MLKKQFRLQNVQHCLSSLTSSSFIKIVFVDEVVQEDGFMSQTDTWKQSCVPSESGIWYCSKCSYKKIEILKNMSSLDTPYADCQITCACRFLQKESHSLLMRELQNFIVLFLFVFQLLLQLIFIDRDTVQGMIFEMYIFRSQLPYRITRQSLWNGVKFFSHFCAL